MKVTAVLGYTAAGLTVMAAMLTPFVLMSTFSQGVTALGLHVDEMYSGGSIARSIVKDGYTIVVHREVHPHMLQRESAFVQVDWKPGRALPPHVTETVDLDGDGVADVTVSFDVPRDAKTPLRATVVPLNGRYAGMRDVGKERFSRLIARVDDVVMVRVPVNADASPKM